jgi:hypothetical protein
MRLETMEVSARGQNHGKSVAVEKSWSENPPWAISAFF